MIGSARIREYDFIKGIAIIAIVVLHSVPHTTLQTILAPWHIWHAAPIFLIVSGALAATRREETIFDLHKTSRSVRKLLLPALAVWLTQLAIVALYGKDIVHYTAELFKRGGFGPGGYYIYIAIQITLLGGLCSFLFQRLGVRALAMLFVLSIICDVISIVTNIDPQLYRVLAFRYMVHFGIGFSYAIGLWEGRRLWATVLIGLSTILLFGISFGRINLAPVYPDWETHTAATSFYSYALFLGLIKVYKEVSNYRIVLVLCFVGSRSYSIFLFQMLYFWVMRGVHTRTSLSLTPLSDVLLAIFSCIAGGLVLSWAMKMTRSFISSGMLTRAQVR